MLRTVLVPVSLFVIEYELGTGRPYSKLESLVLRGVQRGLTDVVSLQQELKVHDRLILDSLVTLIREGWVSFAGSGDSRFALTSQGRHALDTNVPPASRTVIRPRPASVIMERILGLVVPTSEVQLFNKRDLAPYRAKSLEMRPAVDDNRLDPGQVQRLLPLRQGDWVRWVGPITMKSVGNHWIVANVDVINEKVTGLPDRLSTALTIPLLEEAAAKPDDFESISADKIPGWSPEPSPRRRNARSKPDDATDRERRKNTFALPPDSTPAHLRPEDLLVGAQAHAGLLEGVLARAGSRIFVSSAFLSRQAVDYLYEPLRAALQRESVKVTSKGAPPKGLSIDLLWGYEADSVAKNQLGKLAYECKQGGWPGSIVLNAQPSGSHAKLLIWDEAQRFRAIVGSRNWLSSISGDAEEGRQIEASVLVEQPGLVAQLSRCAAALWEESLSGKTSTIPDRWHSIASGLEEKDTVEVVTDENCQLKIVLDREHEAVLRRLLWDSTRSIVISSHRLGSAARTRLSAGTNRTRDSDFEGLVAFGEQDMDPSEFARIHGAVASLGSTLVHRPGLHAKVAIGDERAVIGSYNFLSTDPFGLSRRARELSIEIEGVPARWLAELIKSRLSTR